MSAPGRKIGIFAQQQAKAGQPKEEPSESAVLAASETSRQSQCHVAMSASRIDQSRVRAPRTGLESRYIEDFAGEAFRHDFVTGGRLP